MAPGLPATDVDGAQTRVTELGNGVRFAHVRTPAVTQPTLGAYLVTDAIHERPWLCLLALMPAGDASAHLGWLAHVAALLHDEDARETLRTAPSAAAFAERLLAALTQRSDATSQLPVLRADRPQPLRLVACILRDDDALDHLMTLFVEHGIQGATIIPAAGMAEHVATHMSLFAGFRSAFKAAGRNHLVLTVVPAERTDAVFSLVRDAAGGNADEPAGIAWAMDIAAAMGIARVG